MSELSCAIGTAQRDRFSTTVGVRRNTSRRCAWWCSERHIFEL